MDWHNRTYLETVELLESDLSRGLTSRQAEKRLDENGENILRDEGKRKGVVEKFFDQLNDFLVIVLLSAAAASFIISVLKGDKDFADSFLIIAIVIVNAVIGVVQESKAQKAIDDLKKLTPHKAKVVRDGEVKEIEAKDIVIGDIIVFETGDSISADARLIESVSLKTEESALTGESESVEKDCGFICVKDCHIADRHNMVLAGSFVAYGRGKGVVTATGMDTEVGKIAKLMQSQDDKKTPLQSKLDETGKTLAIGAVLVCVVIFILGVLRQGDIFDMFMTSVSLAVAAIPEGLTAVVTIVLAMGTRRLAAKNAIIRRLPAVETLGSAQIICSDKTGTLTMNKMKTVKFMDMDGASNASSESVNKILTLGALCNNSQYKDRNFTGEPTETAICEGALERGIYKDNINMQFPRVMELPFSSDRKLMTTVHKKNGKYIAVTKGAPEMLIAKCSSYMRKGNELEFLRSDKKKAEEICNAMAGRALRVIAVSKKEFDRMPKESELERDLTLYGFIGIMDTPRPEARKAVGICKKAGIRPLMITGDNPMTAVAIGREVGIFEDGDESVTGVELEKMSQETLIKNIDKYTVFARVTPEHKMRIVKAFQSKKLITAMTGDGVNDAPALKAADIGCAMGKTGTDAAKNAADMIIADDNFATIVEAVKEGRGIYANIQKTVHFLLSSNIGEIITIFVAMVMGWATPLLPIQLLWVNLITDSLPAIALGMDTFNNDLMDREPIENSRSIFSSGLGLRICLEGTMIGMISLLAFAIGHIYYDGGIGADFGRTMAFAVLSISQLVHAYNMRSERSVLKKGFFGNPYLNFAVILGFLMQWSVIMLPSVSKYFKVVSLNLEQWIIVGAFCLIPLIVVEVEKRIIKQ
ncbi:calcium-translocating P-type ATPase, PMCA-type [Anaerotignum faecicola]|nr:calcium-translocating P-type ATPase, PMCA-type [Anaerotignum faecicola]